MSIGVKICGLRDEAALSAAVDAGVDYVGFVFFDRSPRAIGAGEAASLAVRVSGRVVTVGLFVDPTDQDLIDVLKIAPMRCIQLHGSETVERVAAVKALTGLPVIKAVGVSSTGDVGAAAGYGAVADMVLFDAKPPSGGISGGNGVAFDWGALEGVMLPCPWFLSGGINAANVADAVAASGASLVDVSSGVELSRGVKSPEKIKIFIETVRGLVV